MFDNREIKSLENNLSVEATKNIINTPKIAIEKSPIVVKPNVVTSSKIAIEKNINYKTKVCVSEMQLKNIPRGDDNTKNVLTWYYLGGTLT